MKVSVVVPIYNTAKYLDECMNSLCNQTLRDIEFICINDGSTDNSLEILNNYAQIDSRIKVISQKNLGVSAARNCGIKAASGDYIAFLDSDDLFISYGYEKCYDTAIEYDADVVEFLGFRFKDGENFDINQFCYYPHLIEVYERKSGQDPFRTLTIDTDVVTNKLWKREFFIKNNFFFQEGVPLGEDTLFNCLYSSYLYKFVRNKNIFYLRRYDRPGSAMSVIYKDTKKRLDSYMILLSVLAQKRHHLNFVGSDEWILSKIVGWSYKLIVYNLKDIEDKKYYAKKVLTIVEHEFLNKYHIKAFGESYRRINELKHIAGS